MTVKNSSIKNDPEKIINLMGVSEFLTGKKRNITGYAIKNDRVASKHTEKINDLYDVVLEWMEKNS